MSGELESKFNLLVLRRTNLSFLGGTGGGQKISVDGKIITVPTLHVAEFCQQYRLSDDIRELLENEKFETAGAILEVAEGNLEKAGFRQGQIAEVKRALREFLSTRMVITASK